MADSAFPLSSRPSILITADFAEDQVNRLRQMREIKFGGWGMHSEALFTPIY